METLDIIIGMILIISFLFGLSKGFLQSFLSLVGIVAAVYIAISFSPRVEVLLRERMSLSDDLISGIAFLILFILVVIVFSIAGRILTKVASFIMLGWLNRILGGIFNLIQYAFLVSVIFIFVNASEFYSILSEENRENSILYHPIASFAPAILPEIKKTIREMDYEWNPIDTVPRYETPSERADSI